MNGYWQRIEAIRRAFRMSEEERAECEAEYGARSLSQATETAMTKRETK